MSMISSTYPNLIVANDVINKIIKVRRADIKKWLKDPNSRMVKEFDLEIGEVIGRGIKVGETEPSNCTRARVILAKDKNGKYNVMTSYPIRFDIIMNHGEIYNGINALLLYFLVYGEELEPVLDDVAVIKKYVDDHTSIQLKEDVHQGRDILECDFEISAEDRWIANIANRGYSLKFENYKEWMKWVINTLEEEAKNAGKL